MPRKSRVGREPATLSRVAAAIEAGDFPTGLAEALVAWRAARGTELADLVDALDARCREVTIPGSTAQAFQASWMRLAEGKPSPVALGALAASLGRLIPIAKTKNYVDRDIKRYRAFLNRIEALEALPADPRIARAIVELLERAPITIESGRRLYQPAIDLLVELADPRSVPQLRALIAEPTSKASLVRSYFAQALPPAADAIEKAAHQLPEGTRATVRASIAAIEKPWGSTVGRGVDALMAECLAHPDDDGPREVLADVLLEREDPRGEFITLQLRAARGLGGAVSEPERKRIAALLRAHERTWLGGDLFAVTKHRVWRRGFLDQAELQRNAAAEKTTWERAAQDPRLATIRLLAKGGANAPHYESFVLSPATSGLREVTALDVTMMQCIGGLDKPIEHVVLDTPFGLTEEVVHVIGVLVERRSLRRLTIPARPTPELTIELLAEMPARNRVQELIARPRLRSYPRWSEHGATWLSASKQLAPVRRLGIDFAPNGLIVVEPAARGVRVEIEAEHDWLVAWAIEHLPCTHLTIRGPRTGVPRADLATLLRKVPAGQLVLEDGWADLAAKLTSRGRAKRAPRS